MILAWQMRAQKSPTRHYSILTEREVATLQIDSQSLYQHRGRNSWVTVEKYLTGTVENFGGKSEPNIHLSLPTRPKP